LASVATDRFTAMGDRIFLDETIIAARHDRESGTRPQDWRGISSNLTDRNLLACTTDRRR
jgi:hypothetical protein